MSTPILSVIIVAAGKGSRFRQSAGASFAEVKKPFVPLAGKPLFLHSVERFAAMPEVGEQILVVALRTANGSPPPAAGSCAAGA